MKKVILLFAIAVCLASCSDDAYYRDKCYRVNYTMANGIAVEKYEWMSKHAIECQKKLFEEFKYTDVKYTRALKYKTITDCIAQDTTPVYGKLAN